MKPIINFICILLAALPMPVFSGSVNERDMKAALIYNFSVFTTWPDSKADTFTICTFYEDQENINQNMLQSKKINDKPVRFYVLRDKADMHKCQVLYVEEYKLVDDQGTLDVLNNLPILSVVDVSSHSMAAGVVNIKLEDHRYNFSINNEAAKRSSLSLSSRLLRLATKVY